MSFNSNNNNNNDMREPLTGGGDDDNASQSSQRSGASLLERIRAQRNREAATAASSQQENTPSTIQVPQYSPLPHPSSGSNDNNPFGTSSQDHIHATDSNDHHDNSFFSQAWNNISHSMETGMASLQQERGGLEANDALLAPAVGDDDDDDENYSMLGYFMTFVRDVYETFLNLPLWVRIVVIFALLYTAWKLV